MSVKTLSFLALLASAAALDFSNWSPAGPGDSRSPCPGLNAMANHGILPHDGQGLSVPQLQQAMAETYNVARDFGGILAVAGLLTSPNPLGLTFDLSDLDKHNFIEHDASLSRADINEGGDDHTFQPAIFQAFMSNFAGPNTTLKDAAVARFARVKNESQSDAEFTYGPQQFVLSYGETALYLQALGNLGTSVPLTWLQTFFAQEKLPYDQGWRTPSQEIGLVSINLLLPQLQTASGEELQEGLILANNTLPRALLGLDVMGTDIPPLVQGLLNQFGLGGSSQGLLSQF